MRENGIRTCPDSERPAPGIGVFLLLQLLAGYGLSSLCFLSGVRLGGWQFWLSAGAMTAVAFRFSRSLGLKLIGLNLLMFALTAITFTYTHVDASICHLPLAHFLQEGWNPVWQSSPDAVQACFAAEGLPDIQASMYGSNRFAVLHILAAPKFTHILAAQLQSATGLFSAQGYPLWFMTFALLATCHRFAKSLWRVPGWVAASFAALVYSNRFLLFGCYSGLVDLSTYAAIVIAALALVLWQRERRTGDLVLFFAACAITLASKFTGAVPIALLMVLAWVWGWRDRALRTGFCCFLLALPLFCLMPYGTAPTWLNEVKTCDLTRDFVGNADACRMGYLARFVYAWISPRLAVWACAHWYATPGFFPYWEHDFCAGGQTWPFCLLLWGAFLTLFFQWRDRVAQVTIVLFLTFFLLPVKYIGYTRYVAQIYAAIILAYFNLAVKLPARAVRVLSVFALLGAAVLVGGDLHEFWRQLRLEGRRQARIAGLQAEGGTYRMPDNARSWAYAARRRLELEGVAIDPVTKAREPELIWPVMPCLCEEVCLKTRVLTWKDHFWTPGDRLPRPVWSGTLLDPSRPHAEFAFRAELPPDASRTEEEMPCP